MIDVVTAGLQRSEKQLETGAAAAPEQSDEPAQPQEPAVSVRASVRPDYVVCLECGAKAKTLKRHLHNAHGLEPNEYREKWHLKPDHPLTAPNYSAARSSMAKQLGLGARRGRRRKAS